ncbi:uncharacterized protein LOC115210256 [Argonauta hians]
MAHTNVPQDIQECLRAALDHQQKITFASRLKQEIRPEKYEAKLLAFSNWRLNICTDKEPCKLEHSFHFLDIQSLESFTPNKLSLTVDGKQFNFVPHEPDSDRINYLITHIGVSLQTVFPHVPLERLIKKIDVIPSERLNLMHKMIEDRVKKDPGPCGGFSHMYASMCDYHHLPYRDDVAWDVDTIYLTHDTKELKLKDFDHLESRDWLPIISALENNSWFTSLNANNVRVTSEVASEIVKVLRKNAVLEELSMSNTGIKSDFVQKLSVALLSNQNTQLAKVDLSCNVLDDRGFIHFLGFLSKINRGLIYLDLSKSGLTTKGINKLCETMSSSSVIQKSLKTLKIADNPMKGEDMTSLCNFLATPNVLTHLDLSGLEISLEMLSGALVRGCVHHMSHLDLSRNPYSIKKAKDTTIPQSWKLLFASFYQLSYLNLSYCKLPVEAVRLLLLGISSNINVNQLKLDLSGNELRFVPPNEIDVIIGNMTNLTSLDISNNRFDLNIERLFKSLSNNKHLKHLSVGRNFSGIKAKYLPRVLDTLVQLLHDENCFIESLSLADSKLKGDTTLVINALGSNTTLKELDISGNNMEDVGARMLAKALQINNKMQTIIWDKNGTTVQGFQDIAEALEQNYVLKKMPTPVFDAIVAMKSHPEKVEAALQKIECLLQRNHNPRKFSSDQGYRLQQGFLISSTQQMVDRLVVQVQDTVNALSSTSTSSSWNPNIEQADKLVTDANNSQQLLPQLQKIAIKSQDVGNPVEKRLKCMVVELQDVLASHIEDTVQEMLNCAKTQCSTVLQNDEFYSNLKNSIGDKQKLPKDLLSRALTDISTDIFNKLSEMNLSIASHMSDKILEEVIESLSKTHRQLISKLMIKKKLHSNGSHMERENIEKGEAGDEAQEKLSEKPSMDENEKDLPTLRCSSSYSPKLNYKKKSLYGRKLRPQSVIDHDAVQQALKVHAAKSTHSYEEEEEVVDETDATDDSAVGGNVAGTPNIISGRSELNKSTMSLESEISLSSLLSMAGSSQRHPDLIPNRMTKSAIESFDTSGSMEDLKSNQNQSLDSLNFESMTTSVTSILSNSSVEIDTSPTQRLQHINKARPKRRKNHAITKTHAAIRCEVADIKADEGMDNFFNNLRSMKETVSTPEDIGRIIKEKPQTEVNRYSSLSEADRSFVEKKDKSEVSPKHEPKPEGKKKNWNPFDKISNPFSKKPKSDNQKVKAADVDTAKEVREEANVYKKSSLSSPGIFETKGTPETPVESFEKQRNPVNVNMLAEMKQKQDIRASLKDLTISVTNRSDMDTSQKSVSKDFDARLSFTHDHLYEVVPSKPTASPEKKTAHCNSKGDSDTIIALENDSDETNKSPLNSPTDFRLKLPSKVSPVIKQMEADLSPHEVKKHPEKDVIESLVGELKPVSPEIKKCSGDSLNEKALDQNPKTEDETEKSPLRPKSIIDETSAIKPKPAPRTSYVSKPNMKPKPPPPIAPKPSVPSRPSLLRTSAPVVNRNSVGFAKDDSSNEKSNDNESGVIYDSPTLRQSVQEKASRLSKIGQMLEKPLREGMSNDRNETQNTKVLKDFMKDASSRPNSMLWETTPSQKASIQSQSSENEKKRYSSRFSEEGKTGVLNVPLKLQTSNTLNVSTDGLDTSRLSMCSSHHSSTEEAESDAEVIFL